MGTNRILIAILGICLIEPVHLVAQKACPSVVSPDLNMDRALVEDGDSILTIPIVFHNLYRIEEQCAKDRCERRR